MSDEGFSWDDSEDTPAESTTVATTKAAPAAAAAAAAAVTSGGNAAAAAAADPLPECEVPPQEDKNARRPIQLYRHWVRPQFLQYRYMYDYRTNYYNDVIDYLDKRAKGVNAEIPRPQTWAERVLRTHTNPTVLDYYKTQKKEDKHLIQTIAASIRTHNYHTKAYINRKYSSVL